MISFIAILFIFASSAFAQSAPSALPVPNTALLSEYQRNPKIIVGDHDKAYAVNEANLTRYYSDMMAYYMAKYEMTEPMMNRDILDLYLAYLKELPTPVLVDQASVGSSTVLHAMTILMLAKIVEVEVNQRKIVSVVAPPPFIVNVDLTKPDGEIIPVAVATAAVELKKPMVEKHFNSDLLATYSQRIRSLERSRILFKVGIGFFALIALAGAGLGLLGLQHRMQRDRYRQNFK